MQRLNFKNTKLLFGLVLIVFLLLRLPHLGFDISNSDAARWHRRSENFLQALKQGDLASTYQHYQPGVTLMWINAVTKGIISLAVNDHSKTLENADWYPVLHGVSKSVVILVLAFLLLIQLDLLKRLFNLKVSVAYGFLIALEPYMIGMDRWFHLTSLETYFGFTALLLLLYWRKTLKKQVLVFAAVLLALSTLAKLTTLIVLPLFFSIIFITNKKARNLLVFGLLFALTFFTAFPALWINGPDVVSRLFSAATTAVGEDARALEIPNHLKLGFYAIVLGYKLAPLTILFAFLAFLKRKTLPNVSYINIVLIYILYYFFALTFADKKIDRYILVVIPPILLICAAYLSTLTTKRMLVYFGVIVLFVVYVLFLYFPVFSAYYSPLLGGTKTAVKLGIYDNSGEYFAQAAFFLNGDGRDVTVYVPDNTEAFSYFYEGKLAREYSEEVDFIVKSVDMDRKVVTDSDCPYVDIAFGPYDYNVVYVFRCPSVKILLSQ